MNVLDFGASPEIFEGQPRLIWVYWPQVLPINDRHRPVRTTLSRRRTYDKESARSFGSGAVRVPGWLCACGCHWQSGHGTRLWPRETGVAELSSPKDHWCSGDGSDHQRDLRQWD